MDASELAEAWNANNAVNSEWLNLVTDEQMELKAGKGKTIRSNFTHIVSVRRMWLEGAHEIPKLDFKTAAREEIRAGLETSNEGMLQAFQTRLQKGKPVLKFFAYCVAHEANHRAQIELALRLNGYEPEDKVLYALWEWFK